MATFKAQEWVDKNLTDKNIQTIKLSPLTEKEIVWKKDVKAVGGILTENLIIQNYPQLEELGLREHELTSLTVVNCPKLKHINVRNNKLVKLDIEKTKISLDDKKRENEITEIILGENNLTSLNLITCSKIKELIVPDNLSLSKIEGLNWISLKNINITNTSVSLDQENENLRQENKNLYEIIKILDEGGRERKLVLTEPIRTLLQNEVAIKRLLEKTELEWREYFESELPEIELAKKKPLLHLSFRDPKRKYKAKKILIWIIEAQVNGNYEELVKKWNDGNDYNPIYDFDGSLNSLMQYLGIRSYIQRISNKNLEQYDYGQQ